MIKEKIKQLLDGFFKSKNPTIGVGQLTPDIVSFVPCAKPTIVKKKRVRKPSRKKTVKYPSVEIKQSPIKINTNTEILNDAEVNFSNYVQLVSFIDSLPASDRGGIISKYFAQDAVLDKRVEEQLEAKETLYIFDKYKITNMDRKRLIVSILNTKILSQQGNNAGKN